MKPILPPIKTADGPVSINLIFWIQHTFYASAWKYIWCMFENCIFEYNILSMLPPGSISDVYLKIVFLNTTYFLCFRLEVFLMYIWKLYFWIQHTFYASAWKYFWCIFENCIFEYNILSMLPPGNISDVYLKIIYVLIRYIYVTALFAI
jgi:hypothetical protein